ncbi:glycosyl transferase [Candidatus Scalindua japonica]|uniref:Glycosyl transferase n=2 Tax=Candidatus Scalindua japonica TaxID=1284222 RepID=A0A286TWY6_9BACT|nr:glycosyl transferase [Candidatus Scalindua japonica]
MVTDNQSLILIDPLIGFCGLSGSLAKRYGERELAEIRNTIPRIAQAAAISTRTHLVRSEYFAGQFTDGNMDDTLANLCVPDANEDCRVISELSNVKFRSRTTKCEENAFSSKEFGNVVGDDIRNGISKFVVAGFLLEHCVKVTAEKLVEFLSDGKIQVVVCTDLTASRVEKYSNGVVESTKVNLKSKGVVIESWEEASP